MHTDIGKMTCFDSNKLHYVDIFYILVLCLSVFTLTCIDIDLFEICHTHCAQVHSVFREWCYIKCAFYRWISHRINNGGSMAFSAKDIRHVKVRPIRWSIFWKIRSQVIKRAATRVCIGWERYKDLCDRVRDWFICCRRLSSACEWANKRPDEMSTARTKITFAINDIIDFADCCISIWNRPPQGYNALAVRVYR